MGRYTLYNCVKCFLGTDGGNILVKILNEFLTVSVLGKLVTCCFPLWSHTSRRLSCNSTLCLRRMWRSSQTRNIACTVYGGQFLPSCFPKRVYKVDFCLKFSCSQLQNMLLINPIGKPFYVNQLLCCQTSLVAENRYRNVYGYQSNRNLW
jgi:hypothetical protein